MSSQLQFPSRFGARILFICSVILFCEDRNFLKRYMLRREEVGYSFGSKTTCCLVNSEFRKYWDVLLGFRSAFPRTVRKLGNGVVGLELLVWGGVLLKAREKPDRPSAPQNFLGCVETRIRKHACVHLLACEPEHASGTTKISLCQVTGEKYGPCPKIRKLGLCSKESGPSVCSDLGPWKFLVGFLMRPSSRLRVRALV